MDWQISTKDQKALPYVCMDVLLLNSFYYHCYCYYYEMRDITAQWLTEVCTDKEKEPQLQSLSGEIILPRTANKQDDARIDIRAKGFWSRQQDAFLMLEFFTRTHRVTEVPISQHSIDNMRWRRRGSVVTG